MTKEEYKLKRHNYRALQRKLLQKAHIREWEEQPLETFTYDEIEQYMLAKHNEVFENLDNFFKGRIKAEIVKK